MRNGKRIAVAYDWQHDDEPLPPNEQLIIYELHTGDFTGSSAGDSYRIGTFAGVIEKLDYLADLGINAIELMPVNEFRAIIAGAIRCAVCTLSRTATARLMSWPSWSMHVTRAGFASFTMRSTTMSN